MQKLTILMFSVCFISLTKYELYASVMLSIYAKNQAVYMPSKGERECSWTHASNCVNLSKIDLAYILPCLYMVKKS